MKIAIIGIGAMGCLFGAYLAPLAEVVLVGNWPEQIAAIREKGLTLIQPNGRSTHHPLRITPHPTEASPADIALILVKSYQTERAAQQAAQVLSPTGIALTLQNGLGNLEKISAVLGSHRATLGITTDGAKIPTPGVVQHTGYGQTYLAQVQLSVNSEQLSVNSGGTPNAMTLTLFASLLRQAGMEIYVVDDVDSLVWGKLAVNAGINPLTALLRVPNGFLAENEQARSIMQAAAEEVTAVAGAQGIQLPYPSAAERVLQVAQATAVNHSSMLQDVSRGAPTEIEAICGAVVTYGRRYHVPTPLNEKLLEWVRKMEIGDWRLGIDVLANLQSLISNLP